MAAVDQVNVSALAVAGDEDVIRGLISSMFWSWYRKNINVQITIVKFWFISRAVYVRDLRPLFELLFGNEP
jgi:hypothetical protein